MGLTIRVHVLHQRFASLQINERFLSLPQAIALTQLETLTGMGIFSTAPPIPEPSFVSCMSKSETCDSFSRTLCIVRAYCERIISLEKNQKDTEHKTQEKKMHFSALNNAVSLCRQQRTCPCCRRERWKTRNAFLIYFKKIWEMETSKQRFFFIIEFI